MRKFRRRTGRCWFLLWFYKFTLYDSILFSLNRSLQLGMRLWTFYCVQKSEQTSVTFHTFVCFRPASCRSKLWSCFSVVVKATKTSERKNTKRPHCVKSGFAVGLLFVRLFFFAVSTEVSVMSCVEFPSLMMMFYKMRVYLRRNWLFESSLLFLFLALRNFLVRKITSVALAS